MVPRFCSTMDSPKAGFSISYSDRLFLGFLVEVLFICAVGFIIEEGAFFVVTLLFVLLRTMFADWKIYLFPFLHTLCNF